MRLQRWAIIVSAFDYSIRFVPSKQNAVADALSRLPLPSTLSGENAIFKVEERLVDSLPVTHKEISHATQVDPVLSKVLEFVRHEIRMKELARSYLWWPNVDIQIEQMVKNCASCQKVRKPPAVAPLMPWFWPSNPWHRIHTDYAEDENGHYLIVVDAHSRWPEIFYMPRNTSAGATISILRELLAKYGLPAQCVSDNGPQFCSEDFARFLKLNGVKHIRVAPYHAASNGLAERIVQSFKTHMKTCKGSSVLPTSYRHTGQQGVP